MLRRAMASAATHFKVPDKTNDGKFIGLGSRIAQLRDRLLPATYAAAQNTKILGDGGAHEEAEDSLPEGLGPIDAQTMGLAIEIGHHILANLFDIPAQVDEMKSILDGSGNS
jgi:hypothetical protein